MKLFLQVLTFATLAQQAQGLLNHIVCPLITDAIEDGISDTSLGIPAECDCNIKLGIFHGLQIDIGCSGQVLDGVTGSLDLSTRKKAVTAVVGADLDFVDGDDEDATAGAMLTIKGTQTNCFNPTEIALDPECDITVQVAGVSVKCDSCMASGSILEIPNITPDCDNLVDDFLNSGVDIGDLLTVLLGVL